MKNIIIIILFGLFNNVLIAQVGIGTTSPDSSSALDITSDNSGILIPRLTTSNRLSMANVEGMLVYDKDFDKFYYNDGAVWYAISNTINVKQTQSGTENIGASTNNNWKYVNVTFASSFTSVPSIVISYREGSGTDNSGSHTVDHLKVANATTTGFTIAIHDSSGTNDIYVDWIATEKTQ